MKDILPEMACKLWMQCDLVFGILKCILHWGHNRCGPQGATPYGESISTEKTEMCKSLNVALGEPRLSPSHH